MFDAIVLTFSPPATFFCTAQSNTACYSAPPDGPAQAARRYARDVCAPEDRAAMSRTTPTSAAQSMTFRRFECYIFETTITCFFRCPPSHAGLLMPTDAIIHYARPRLLLRYVAPSAMRDATPSAVYTRFIAARFPRRHASMAMYDASVMLGLICAARPSFTRALSAAADAATLRCAAARRLMRRKHSGCLSSSARCHAYFCRQMLMQRRKQRRAAAPAKAPHRTPEPAALYAFTFVCHSFICASVRLRGA